ncbi:MAG: GAF domain-containing protein [Chloroflexi bacterium]|nr:GAF domain-containing protein [Chloroflexota bacterium]
MAQTGNWIYSNDVSHHPFVCAIGGKLCPGPETQSILCVPLIYRGQVVGALELINKRDGDFDDQDAERAASIAAAVAIATANAMSFDEIDAR